jgi:hypothetical protein
MPCRRVPPSPSNPWSSDGTLVEVIHARKAFPFLTPVQISTLRTNDGDHGADLHDLAGDPTRLSKTGFREMRSYRCVDLDQPVQTQNSPVNRAFREPSKCNVAAAPGKTP